MTHTLHHKTEAKQNLFISYKQNPTKDNKFIVFCLLIFPQLPQCPNKKEDFFHQLSTRLSQKQALSIMKRDSELANKN